MPQNPKKTLVLLDTHAIIHRAYHALPDFASSKGEPTGALYGLCLMLFRIIDDFHPDYIVATFDLPKPTYRHEAYEGYKAGRKKTDDALVLQLKKAHEVFEAFNIPMYSKEGFEADDMLGTIVEETKTIKGLHIIIASGDMDTMQLVDNEHIQVFTLRKGVKDTILYGEKEIFERFGFRPAQLTDYKGLRGDTSDNIIGIKGIGEKTATTLIQEFGTIENMYEEIEKGNKERFKKIGVTDRIYNLIADNKDEALFSKMLATIRRDAPIDFVFPTRSFQENLEPLKVKKLLSELEFRSLIAKVDTLSGSVVIDEDVISKTPPHSDFNVSEEDIEKYKIATFVLNSQISNPEISDILAYSLHSDIHDAMQNIDKEITKQNLDTVLCDIEIPLIPIIKRMHNVGIAIDKGYMMRLSKEYHNNLNTIDQKIYGLVGKEFNIDSPKQLGVILFDDLKLVGKNMKKTAGGAKSTKESELEKLKDLHPVVPLIMEHRELSKLLSTYIDVIPTLLDDKERLHPTFIQTGAATGRMASKDPGVQNIPVKTEMGRAIRNGFVAEKGYKLCAFDYSQIELRIAAILSGDTKLQGVFKTGEDAHAGVASQVFGVPLDEVTKDMRRKAKAINFGILYGMGVNALKQNLGSTREEAQKFYDDYFKTFATLAEYLENTKKDAAKNGFVTTMYGRRRYFEGIKSKLPFIRAAAERMAINAPIQGTQADIMKIAMRQIDDEIKKEDAYHNVRLLLQIHDELIYEIKEGEVEKWSQKIKSIMESVLDKEKTKGVPIIVNASSGENWGEMK